jgi:hypothetical protein
MLPLPLRGLRGWGVRLQGIRQQHLLTLGGFFSLLRMVQDLSNS